MESTLSSFSANYRIRQIMLEKAGIKQKGVDMNMTQSHSTKLQGLSDQTPLHITTNKLGVDLLYNKTINEEEPRRRHRFQRRNSAVASMLFSSAYNAAALCQKSSRTLPSLQLSSAIGSISPLEALKKAKELMDRDMPPDLAKTDLSTPIIKRVVSEDLEDEAPARKRQRAAKAPAEGDAIER